MGKIGIGGAIVSAIFAIAFAVCKPTVPRNPEIFVDGGIVSGGLNSIFWINEDIINGIITGSNAAIKGAGATGGIDDELDTNPIGIGRAIAICRDCGAGPDGDISILWCSIWQTEPNHKGMFSPFPLPISRWCLDGGTATIIAIAKITIVIWVGAVD